MRAVSSSAFSWKPNGVSITMALASGWLTRAIKSWWTDVMAGLVSPEPNSAISRGGDAWGSGITSMLPVN